MDYLTQSEDCGMVQAKGTGRITKMSLTERLESERTGLTERIARLDEAITALKSNPDVERLINIITRL